METERGSNTTLPELIRVIKDLDSGIDTNLITDNCKYFADDFTCKICLGLVITPEMCSTCDSLFCKICITKSLKNSFKCPIRYQYKSKEINKLLKNILDKVQLKCLNSGCSEIINYGILTNHLKSCDYGFFKCVNEGCNYTETRIKVLEHFRKFPFQVFFCEFCKETYKGKHLEIQCLQIQENIRKSKNDSVVDKHGGNKNTIREKINFFENCNNQNRKNNTNKIKKDDWQFI